MGCGETLREICPLALELPRLCVLCAKWDLLWQIFCLPVFNLLLTSFFLKKILQSARIFT